VNRQAAFLFCYRSDILHSNRRQALRRLLPHTRLHATQLLNAYSSESLDYAQIFEFVAEL